MIKLHTFWPIEGKSISERLSFEQKFSDEIINRYSNVDNAYYMYKDWLACGENKDHDFYDTLRIAFVRASKGLYGKERDIKPEVIFEVLP